MISFNPVEGTPSASNFSNNSARSPIDNWPLCNFFWIVASNTWKKAVSSKLGLPIIRWKSHDFGKGAVLSSYDLTKRGYDRGDIAFYAATLDGSQTFDPKHGYVYWVHIRGKNDFNCCQMLPSNPTRQTQLKYADFFLAQPPAEDGYEGTVCSPTCGTGGGIVWSGPVQFDAAGRLRLTPEGPVPVTGMSP